MGKVVNTNMNGKPEPMDNPQIVEINFDEDFPVVDREAESTTLNIILDRIEETKAKYRPLAFSQISLNGVGPITPWVAKQLGRLSHRIPSHPSLLTALDFAAFAVRAGRESRHMPTFYDNIITMGNIYFVAKQFEEAERIYARVLAESSPDCLKQRGVAHLSMSQVQSVRGNALDAGHHMELALCCLQHRIRDEQLNSLLGRLVNLFSETKQLGALIHVGVMSGFTPSEVIEELKVKNLSLNQVVAAATVLNILNNSITASLLRSSWLALNDGAIL